MSASQTVRVDPFAEHARGPVRLMAHLVAGYPDMETTLAAADGLAAGGVSFFEIQFPFSDPSADGPAIQTACSESLGKGFTVSDGFALTAKLAERYPDIPVYIMSYANLVFHAGIEAFAQRARAAGVSGLIVPDLPFDSDEGLDVACRSAGLLFVPVAAPSMSDDRIALLGARRFPLVYAALRAGITGQQTVVDGSTLGFLSRLKEASGGASRILGGFGIRTGEQSRSLAPAVHAVIVGSRFVEEIAAVCSSSGAYSAALSGDLRDALQRKAAEFIA